MSNYSEEYLDAVADAQEAMEDAAAEAAYDAYMEEQERLAFEKMQAEEFDKYADIESQVSRDQRLMDFDYGQWDDDPSPYSGTYSEE